MDTDVTGDFSKAPCSEAFITLTPLNNPAIIGFGNVVTMVSKTPVQYAGLIEHMSTDQYNSSMTSADTDIQDDDGRFHPRRSGYFTLCLCVQHAPLFARHGWTFGTLNRRTNSTDLCLDTGRSSLIGGLRNRHGSLLFTETNNFCIQVTGGREIFIDEEKLASGQSRGFTSDRDTILKVAGMEYIVSFTAFNFKPEFMPKYQAFRHRYGLAKVADYMTPTPTPDDFVVGRKYVTGQTIAVSKTGWVTMAKDITGTEFFAVKHFNTKKHSRALLDMELAFIQGIPEQENLVDFVEFIYEESTSIGHIFMQPLGLGSLEIIALETEHSSKQLEVTRQILRGLQSLHQSNIAHRDIKESNVIVNSISPPHLVIIDFDNAIAIPPGTKLPPTRGTVGTRHALAPETEESPYDFGVDMWACGYIGAQMLFGKRFPGRHPWRDILAINHLPGEQIRTRRLSRQQVQSQQRRAYILPQALAPNNRSGTFWYAGALCDIAVQDERVLTLLPLTDDDQDTGTLSYLIRQLLQCDPEKRPKASQALDYGCFKALKVNSILLSSGGKRLAVSDPQVEGVRPPPAFRR